MCLFFFQKKTFFTGGFLKSESYTSIITFVIKKLAQSIKLFYFFSVTRGKSLKLIHYLIN